MEFWPFGGEFDGVFAYGGHDKVGQLFLDDIKLKFPRSLCADALMKVV